jgi:hypothetical protein
VQIDNIALFPSPILKGKDHSLLHVALTEIDQDKHRLIPNSAGQTLRQHIIGIADIARAQIWLQAESPDPKNIPFNRRKKGKNKLHKA